MRKTAFFAAMLSLGASFPAAAGEVAGTVYDQRGTPVAGVILSVDGQEAISAEDGSYLIADVSAGQQMITANGQRAAVDVADDGTATRNIFLLSHRARTEVTGASVGGETAGEAFSQALELAEQMLETGPATREVTWRWNDHEA